MIERNVSETDLGPGFALLKEACIGCSDCKGTCLALVQLARLPDFLLNRRKAYS